MAVPSLEKQSEIIGQIDELIELSKKEIKVLEEMRTTLLVHWSVKGDKEAFKKIFDGDRYGEHIMPWAPQKARKYFKMYIEEWRERIRQRGFDV